jgi:hypothetical protein
MPKAVAVSIKTKSWLRQAGASAKVERRCCSNGSTRTESSSSTATTSSQTAIFVPDFRRPG